MALSYHLSRQSSDPTVLWYVWGEGATVAGPRGLVVGRLVQGEMAGLDIFLKKQWEDGDEVCCHTFSSLGSGREENR